jgi:two-component system, cell cycle response regulator DivK
MKVLYVEDNPANVFLVKRVARMGNHEIINYIDGGQALKKYDEINPDLVLMDIQLAGDKSGLDVVRELRARGVKTPIIAVTAYAMVGDKERCIDAGCDDYLAKPLPIPRLVEIFEAHNRRVLASKPAIEVTPVVVAEAPKAEAAPVLVVEVPKVETAPATIVEAPKTEVAPTAEAPKAEAAPVLVVEAPKVETAPVVEAPKVETAPASEAAPAAEKPRTATAPLIEIPEAKAADAQPANDVKAVETPPASSTEPKAAEDGKKEAEQTSVKPGASSS